MSIQRGTRVTVKYSQVVGGIDWTQTDKLSVLKGFGHAGTDTYFKGKILFKEPKRFISQGSDYYYVMLDDYDLVVRARQFKRIIS